MWLQTSQNVGFLKMCSMKQCPVESTCSGLRDCEREVGGGAQGMAGGTGGMGRLAVCGGAIPMLQRWLVLPLTSDRSSVLLSLLLRKKLSALLLRMLLVLKDRERLSLCSWNQRERVEEELGKTEKEERGSIFTLQYDKMYTISQVIISTTWLHKTWLN